MPDNLETLLAYCKQGDVRGAAGIVSGIKDAAHRESTIDSLLDFVEKEKECRDTALICNIITLFVLCGFSSHAGRCLRHGKMLESPGDSRIRCSVDEYEANKIFFYEALRGIGVGNHENFIVSGERGFLSFHLGAAGDPVVFDIGANVGLFSVAVKRTNPRATVYAFEPGPVSYAVLKKNARRHGFFPFNLALSDEEKETVLYDRDEYEGSEHASVYKDVITDIYKTKSKEYAIRCTTIDKFIEEKKISGIDLVKIDTEGHELAVLQGARETIRQGLVKAFHIEFNEMNVYSRTFMRDVFAILPEYAFFRLLPDGMVPLEEEPVVVRELFAFQNIVALRK